MKKRYLVGLDEQQGQWYVLDVSTREVEMCANHSTARYIAVTKNVADNRSEPSLLVAGFGRWVE